MALIIYKQFSNFFSFFVLLFFFIRLSLSKENLKSIKEKFFFFDKRKRPKGKLIWINGVSIGEAKSGLIIANKILKRFPKSTILLSTSTLSAYNLISNLDKRIILIFSPLDISFIIKRFINKWNPDLTVFMESEIWPNIINEIKKKKLRYVILNARMSEKSFEFWKKLIFFSKKIFSKIDVCYAQDILSKNRFKDLGAKNVKLSGNLKFLSDQLKFDQAEYKKLKKELKSKKIITLFSSHRNEETFLINCSKSLEKKINNLFFIIIPRHPIISKNIQQNCKKNKINFAIRSQQRNSIKNKKFYIVDSFGELGLFFKLSHISIVGGSFVNNGGHNPIETNNFDCALIFGQYMQNFVEIEKKIIETKSGFRAKNIEELEEKILSLLKNKKLWKNTVNNFKKMCAIESKKLSSIIEEIYN